MSRPDGRIEKGQRLTSAISARAWNRAQDAADIVLGVTPGMVAGDVAASRLSLLTVVVPKTEVDRVEGQMPNGVKLTVGSAIDIPQSSATLYSSVSGLTAPQTNRRVNAEEDLPSISTQRRGIKVGYLSLGMSDNFGVISSRSDPRTNLPPETPPETDVTFSVIVGGVLSCRVLAFGVPARLAGPVPVWGDNDPYPLSAYRPLPVLAPAGNGVVLALGSYWRLTGAEWPRVYEALVRIG